MLKFLLGPAHQRCVTVAGLPNAYLYNERQTVEPSFSRDDAS